MPDISVEEGKRLIFIQRSNCSAFIISKDERKELIKKLEEGEGSESA